MLRMNAAMGLVSRSRFIVLLTGAVVLSPIVALRADEQVAAETPKPWLPELEVEQYRLLNGLTVILHEDHKTPLVAVNITYSVGSKDDPPGRTGLAHLFEHMMFKGSQHSDWNYFGPIYPYYAKAQGTTEYDRTVYNETVTSNALELVLWLEADRMGFLLPALTEEKLANAREVVMMERRQNFDDPPLGEVEDVLSRALYPSSHPYRHWTIGSLNDLSAVRLWDISAFFHKHYAPNHAFLCVAGDFKRSLAKRWIAKYFGRLSPCKPATVPTKVETTATEPRRITLTEQVGHDRVMLVWKTVPAYHPDEAALDALASVLGGDSKWNRLFRALVDDRPIATEISASHPTHQFAGRFEVTLIARNGQKLDELVRRADEEIDRLKREGPTEEEVRRVKIERRTLQIDALDSVTSKASVLAYNAAALGNPLGYRATLAKIFAVTPADVVRVARQYLGKARIELNVLRGERVGRAYETAVVRADLDQRVAGRRVERMDLFDRSVEPACPPTPRFAPPVFRIRKLGNGLELRTVERRELPHVTICLVVKSGETSTPAGKEGLASIAAYLLREGTKSRFSAQLETDLLDLGATLSVQGLLESTTVTLSAPTRNLNAALDLFADMVLNPSLPVRELDRLKLARLATLEWRSHDASKIAEDVFPRLLYHPGHPYARPERGTCQSIQSITRDDVVAFYRRSFVPGNAAIVVVGDVRPHKIEAALEARFGKWPANPSPARVDVRPIAASGDYSTIYLIDTPGAEQSILSVGRTGAAVNASERHSFEILVSELGGRINSHLREDKGFSYGFSASLTLRNGPGPMVVNGSVHTLETKDALLAIFKEMTDLADANSLTQTQIARLHDGMVAPWFERFETIGSVAAEVANLVSRELPADHFATELARYAAVTDFETTRLAERHLAPRQMTTLVVGDRGWIEASLRALPFVKRIRLLDSQGNPLPDRSAFNLAPEQVADQKNPAR